MESNNTAKILIVDDEANNRLLLSRMLTHLGHESEEAENAHGALQILDRSFDLVLADVMMPPGLDGFELTRIIRNNPETQDIPVIIVTTLSEREDRLQAVEAGANDFITKPVDLVELKVRTRSMLKQKAQHDEIKRYQEELISIVNERTKALKQTLKELDKAHIETIQHLSAAAEYKDDDTAAHIRRMSGYATLIAKHCGLSQKEIDFIRICSPMHDIGKIGIPDNILLKPAKLTAEEWIIMKTHTNIGNKILAQGDSEYMKMGAIIAMSHHEKWDGSGYPAGLAGEDIPLQGRICAIADVFDALTSKRPYKEPFTLEKSIEIMKEGHGTHFDPKMLDIFTNNLHEVRAIKEKYQDGIEDF